MLKQVMLNLFINAQQAMAEGGELMVRTKKINSNAQIQISDTGPGIGPDKIEHIFEPFFSSKHGGSGLGLATARRIVDAHNGSLTVASEPGKGTAFTIEIPLASS
jgi:two-component system sensor histidine kinase HydH